MLVSPDTPRFLAARLLLGAWLACGAGAQAQTLLDTSAAIGVQNTLNQIQPGVTQVPGSLSVQFDACKMAPESCKDGQPIGAAPAPATSGQSAQNAQSAQPAPSQVAPAAPTTPTQTTPTPAGEAPQLGPCPLSCR
ncbi:hypothetical protein MSS93_12305 [Deinococcus radiodurans]|nr:hypothetical protein MSS93_12305 [Deinococcus radiodurans]